MEGTLIKVDETSIRLIKALFDSRIQVETEDANLESFSKAMRIKSLQNKIVSFVNNNPVSNVVIKAPDFETKKEIVVSFSNYSGEFSGSDITIQVKDNWEEAELIFTPLVGLAKPLVTLKG